MSAQVIKNLGGALQIAGVVIVVSVRWFCYSGGRSRTPLCIRKDPAVRTGGPSLESC